MKRLSPWLLVLIALPAFADILRSWQVTTTNTDAGLSFTGTAPTAECGFSRTGTATTGLRLDSCRAYYVCVTAQDAGAPTLSGAGTLQARFYEPVEGAWSRAGQADELLDSAATGERSFCFPQRPLAQDTPGCAYWTPSGVTTDGGTSVRLYARCVM